MANSPSQLARRGKPTGAPRFGKLYTYKYIARESPAPYFDMYPTIFLISKFSGGFVGINFNYIDHDIRIVMHNKMKPFIVSRNNEKFLLFRQFAKLLNSRAWRPILMCVRSYNYRNLKTPMIEVDDTIWDETIHRCDEKFFRTKSVDDRFIPLKSEIVWRETLKQIRSS